MTKLDKIKSTIEKLSDEDVLKLRNWLAEIDAERFDKRIEVDAAAGKLDALVKKAKARHAAGRTREL